MLDNNAGQQSNSYFLNNRKMSAEEVVADIVCCACCGIAAVDNAKLKKCDGGCDLVKYCSVDCQNNHREKHEQECKKKRKDELRDNDLFDQPDSSYLGECPLCCLPLPLDPRQSTLMGCCCKIICSGCNYANKKREIEGGLEQRCAFCREPIPKSDKEHDKRIMKRIKKHNDPVAMTEMGKKYYRQGEYGKALEYHKKAAELGDAGACCLLGTLYYKGEGVEEDEEKAVYHLEKAAIGGHPDARFLLAVHEMDNGRFERAVRHFIINANLGCDFSLQKIKELFVEGIVSKEEYAAALRGFQAAVNETKSAERDKVEAASSAIHYHGI